MAANFQQHMGGPGQMMPQQQQQRQQQQQQQQRGPQNGNATNAMQQMIFNTLNTQTGNLTGWQAQVLIQERIGLIFNIIGNLRLASQHQANPPNLHKMVDIAIRFEREIFEKSADKNAYKRAVEKKLEQLLERRNQNQAGLQQSINQQAQAQAQAQAQQAQANQMMMNQNGMQGQVPRNMPQQPAQQGFQHLQHQMQASPIPGQQSQQMAMGLLNEGMPPNMTPNQQQFQMTMQQPQQPQPPPQQNVPGRPQNAQMNMSPQDSAIVMDLAHRMMAAASSEEKNNLRGQIQQRLDAAIIQKYQASGSDPLILYYRNQAVNRIRAERQRIAQAQAQQQLGVGVPQQPQNLPAAPPMQQQRSMNPSPLNGQAQPPTSIGGNPELGAFMGNMENLAVQQQQGVMAQEAGQMVVPASGAPRNATPQPGGMPGPPMNMNDQRNPNPRAQQQQQMFNVQQAQQQRLQHAAQQQQQSQARLNAQTKAQQMALQGQPGGMGSGPMPPQQSPAMATLNAPLRTPQQMNHPEPPQVNPTTQFGQPLDPRFMQGNQRQLGPGNGMNVTGLTPAMFANMSQDQQQRMMAMPPEKLNEVVSKWNEQRMQQMNTQNMQGARPQMAVNNQVRPGQPIPQPGQINPMAAAQHFMAANPGQGLPPSIMNVMTAQEQMALRQQVQRMQQNPLQQHNAAQNLALTNEQRTVAQMDNMDVPPAVLTHHQMPRDIPPHIRKWGQLKQWVHQNPSLGPPALEPVKNLQRLHYQNILKTRSQQAGQPGMMQQGPQVGQMGIPAVPPSMSAPVAPMGQNPIHMKNGMGMGGAGIRPPTQEEIQRIRSNPQAAQMSDDQIRAWLARKHAQMTPQQLQQRNSDLLQMQMNQMSHMNGQQARLGAQAVQPQPQPNNSSTGPAQQMQNQVSQAKPPQSASENTKTAASTGRQAQQQQNARNAAQNSSPAQPPKNLKRASSDDVVEVPNPNAQQPRSTPQQSQGPNQGPQQQLPSLTPQQIAALDPENRKKYEAYLRVQAARSAQLGPTDMQKLRTISQEEAKRASEQSQPDISMDQETRTATANGLRAIVAPLNNVHKAVPKWFQITHDEGRARAFFRNRIRILAQFRDAEMSQLKDTFSMKHAEVEQARLLLNSMVKVLSQRFPTMIKAETQPQPTPTPQSTAQPSQAVSAPSIPLNAANLQQQQQQLNKMHQRSNSRSSQTPAAPTSSQPPFQFAAPSPHGAPSYIGKSTITQNDLHLPVKKKQKQNNNTPVPGQSTPGSNSSPQVSKAVSSEVKRQQAEMKPQPKPSLCCSEPECDRHSFGFDSEEALRLHTQEEHIRPLENPAKYAQDNLASSLNLDSQGRSKKAPMSAAQESRPTPAGVNMAASGSKQGQGQTPNIKGENTSTAATPMNRQVSMNRQSSAAGSKQKTVPPRETGSKSQAGQKYGNKEQGSQPSQEAAPVDPWANTFIDPHDLFQTFQTFESGSGGAISDMTVYRSITPNESPESSKDGVSEPNSDISDGVALDISLDIFDDKWMPFGPSESDAMFDMNSFNVRDEDSTMYDDELPITSLQSWEDMVDTSAFDKPFSFDTSFFSPMDAN